MVFRGGENGTGVSSAPMTQGLILERKNRILRFYFELYGLAHHSTVLLGALLIYQFALLNQYMFAHQME